MDNAILFFSLFFFFFLLLTKEDSLEITVRVARDPGNSMMGKEYDLNSSLTFEHISCNYRKMALVMALLMV